MMDMEQNLSQLYYVKNNLKNNVEEPDSFVRELSRFKITESTIHGSNPITFFEYPGASNFTLTTTYPGLLIGSGYSHPAIHNINKNDKKDLSDFQLGFFFDHTTGLPVIPGSSVKGVLKSIFSKPGFGFGNEKLQYINFLLPADKKEKDYVTHNNWEDIFFQGSPKGKKPVFLDAYISDIPANGQILADDYITPHTGGIFKDPTPIRFVKIAPNVKITFQFLLHDYQGNGFYITGEEITRVFRDILLEFGIGAKRNVGYGNLVEH